MEATEEATSERSVTPMKESMRHIDETTGKTRKLQTTEMETAFVQERAEHENIQDGKAPVRDTGELQIALDSAGSETPVAQPDGGLWGWIVCLTAMMNYGTVTGLINALSLVYVIMLKEFSEGDVSIAFKICKFFICVCVLSVPYGCMRAHAERERERVVYCNCKCTV